MHFGAGDAERLHELLPRDVPLILACSAAAGNQEARGGGEPPLQTATGAVALHVQIPADAFGEIGRRVLALERTFEFLFQRIHYIPPKPRRSSLPRSSASERCRWLFTVATGISS